MKKMRIIQLSLVVALIIGIVIATVSFTRGASSVSEPSVVSDASAVSESVPISSVLEDRIVVMDDEYLGYAFSEAKLKSLVADADAAGKFNLSFLDLMKDGILVTDNYSGVTFLTSDGQVYLADIACVVDLERASFDALLNNEIRVNELTFVSDVETSFGGFKYFRW